MTEVVPKYFAMNKYQSFQRQINSWGFECLHQTGNDKGAYYHEYFLRGMPHLLVLIQRVPPKPPKGKTKVLKCELPTDEEPNFSVKMDMLQPSLEASTVQQLNPTLPSCPNKRDQYSLSEDLNITPTMTYDRPILALNYDTNQQAQRRRYYPTTMTDIHDLPNQQHQLTHPLQYQNTDLMCSVENQSTISYTSKGNIIKCKVDAVLQAFMKRSFEMHNMEYEPTASANGSAEGAHHHWNNDFASLITCSRNDAVEKIEEEMVAHSVVRQREEGSHRLCSRQAN